MSIVVRGHVRSGRLVVDEPIDLPDNAEVDVAILDGEEPDMFDAEERARLDAAITAGKEAMARRDVVPAEQVLAEL